MQQCHANSSMACKDALQSHANVPGFCNVQLCAAAKHALTRTSCVTAPMSMSAADIGSDGSSPAVNTMLGGLMSLWTMPYCGGGQGVRGCVGRVLSVCVWGGASVYMTDMKGEWQFAKVFMPGQLQSKWLCARTRPYGKGGLTSCIHASATPAWRMMV